MTKTLEVIATPALVNLYDLKGKNVVVIDILRATSTICTALFNGANSVIPVLDTNTALEYEQENYLLAAERGGQKVEGFLYGNSPKEYTKEVVQDKSVVLTTTNGTKSILLSEGAHNIYIGSFLNISILAEHLKQQPEDVVLFCAGWKDKFNLEDFLFAGDLALRIQDSFEFDCDSTEAAMDLYNAAKSDLTNYVKKASHSKRFKRMGVVGDIELCLEKDSCPVIPVLNNGHLVSLIKEQNQ